MKFELASRFDILVEEDMTANVVRSLGSVHVEKKKFVDSFLNGFMTRKIAKSLYGTKGSWIYNSFVSRKKVYYRFEFRKPE